MCCNQNFGCKTIPLCYCCFYLTFLGFVFSLVLNWPFSNLNTGSFFTIWGTREGVLTSLWCMSVLSHFSYFQLFSTLWTGAHKVPLSMGLSRQDSWKELPCPPPRGSSPSRDQTHVSYVSCIGRWVLYHLGSPFLWLFWCVWLCDPMDCSTPGLPVYHQLLEFTQTLSIESVMPSNHLILCRPLLCLPSIFSSIRVFSDESVLCIRWPSNGVSPSASVLQMNIQDWFPLGWTSWISLHSKGPSWVFSNTRVQKNQFFGAHLSL